MNPWLLIKCPPSIKDQKRNDAANFQNPASDELLLAGEKTWPMTRSDALFEVELTPWWTGGEMEAWSGWIFVGDIWKEIAKDEDKDNHVKW